MAHHGPLVTAVVVVGGLIGFMTVNSAGGLVAASDTTNAAAESTETAEPTEPPATTQPPATTTEPPATTEPPPTTSEAPAAPAFPAEAVYAGKATGGGLAVAVAVKGDEAAAYLCDGASVEAWLSGTAVDGRLDLTSKDGASKLSGGLEGQALAGAVTLAGQELPFSIAPAAAPAGLYRGEGTNATIGWIVLPDGSQVGIVKSSAGKKAAPELDPATGAVTVDGMRVSAAKVAGDTTFG